MNNRQKNTNYSIKREELKKRLTEIRDSQPAEGAVIPDEDKVIDAFLAAGYTVSSAKQMMKPGVAGDIGIKEIVNSIWPVEERTKEVKDISKEARSEKNYGSALKGIELLNKMAGDFEPTETNVNVKGSVKHDHELTFGSNDYLEYKKQKLESKKVIDGEVVD